MVQRSPEGGVAGDREYLITILSPCRCPRAASNLPHPPLPAEGEGRAGDEEEGVAEGEGWLASGVL